MTVINTSMGPVPTWGRRNRYPKDVLLVVRGLLPSRDHMMDLVERLPEVDVIVLHLPGMHTPYFRDHSLGAFSTAFDEVIDQLHRNRDVHVLGASLGGLVAFGLRHPAIRSIVALDTPLTTRDLWPIWSQCDRITALSSDFAEWLWSIAGYRTAGAPEPRDYRALVSGLTAPTTVLLGGEPLMPPRPYRLMPSLVGEKDRAVYRDSQAALQILPGVGHNIPVHGADAMMSVLRRNLGLTSA